MEIALGLAGRIGSGKTSLASELARRLECPRASFGDYVRSVAEDRGLDAGDREVLQTVGDELIAQSWESFCRGVLDDAAYAGGSVVVDGVRHHDAAATLRPLVAPVRLLVVAVASPDDERLLRLAGRGLTDDEITRADAHPNEGEVLDVVAAADFVVDGRLSVAEAADEVMVWLRNLE
jgi:dephospho-CoA kinase